MKLKRTRCMQSNDEVAQAETSMFNSGSVQSTKRLDALDPTSQTSARPIPARLLTAKLQHEACESNVVLINHLLPFEQSIEMGNCMTLQMEKACVNSDLLAQFTCQGCVAYGELAEHDLRWLSSPFQSAMEEVVRRAREYVQTL